MGTSREGKLVPKFIEGSPDILNIIPSSLASPAKKYRVRLGNLSRVVGKIDPEVGRPKDGA